MSKQIENAKKAMLNAYTPYSKFNVGAALEFNDGTYVLGSNIENASYGLSNCAERSAMFSAISQGYNLDNCISLTVIGDTDTPISPCGACRQVMAELLPKGTKIILASTNGLVKETTIEQLLPYSFSKNDLN
jgi:cytidine deaminase